MPNRLAADRLPPLLTVREVCVRLKIDERTLRRHRRLGLFPKPDTYVGRSPRWFERTVANHLADPPDVTGIMHREAGLAARRKEAV